MRTLTIVIDLHQDLVVFVKGKMGDHEQESGDFIGNHVPTFLLLVAIFLYKTSFLHPFPQKGCSLQRMPKISMVQIPSSSMHRAHLGRSHAHGCPHHVVCGQDTYDPSSHTNLLPTPFLHPSMNLFVLWSLLQNG